ncbi:DUF4241 domain-containing protein [Streptacidiphilus sp. PB12-B1b]|uniref:DUF4241 domain-containing protein n=1 Tax=Streptacidiphilus sp. PB12-B1b TaxID=2705012 RepID=UPI0015F79A97|nr:DUF4241 domain-containing protein [Streptacidiphilus sp. PB12-B1b]QMU77360.1 DUF4241 domain-containing protein [Streptacidiphilus sp. PB12-B1b]
MDHETDVRLAAGPDESRYLDAVFVPGAQLGTRSDDPTAFVRVVEVRDVTKIRIPSGRLVVDSPWPEDDDPLPGPHVGRELAVRIPAGVFRVEAAWTEAPYEFMGERFADREVAAVRLCITEDAVTRWEMALGVEDDIETVHAGERVGFDSETGMGCFADAAAWEALTAPFRAFWKGAREGIGQPRDTESLCNDFFERVSDEGHGADLLAFTAEGACAVWLGRTATGALASVAVADGYHAVAGNPGR